MSDRSLIGTAARLPLAVGGEAVRAASAGANALVALPRLVDALDGSGTRVGRSSAWPTPPRGSTSW